MEMKRKDGRINLPSSGRPWFEWQPTKEDLQRGFKGWHYRGYLPHFDIPNVTQLVTFMLHDSFPASRRQEFETLLKSEEHSERYRQLEHWLERGHGDCWLRKPAVASRIEETLFSNNGMEYQLQSWVVMPNHVHLVVDVWNLPLAKMIQTWKGASARAANELLGRTGRFWQANYFDILIRDDDHLKKAISYIEANPTKAGLIKAQRNWPWSSARFRNQFNQLNIATDAQNTSPDRE